MKTWSAHDAVRLHALGVRLDDDPPEPPRQAPQPQMPPRTEAMLAAAASMRQERLERIIDGLYHRLAIERQANARMRYRWVATASWMAFGWAMAFVLGMVLLCR